MKFGNFGWGGTLTKKSKAAPLIDNDIDIDNDLLRRTLKARKIGQGVVAAVAQNQYLSMGWLSD